MTMQNHVRSAATKKGHASGTESIVDEKIYAEALMRRIEAECPNREPASAGEMRAQEILAGELASQGLDDQLVHFRFNRNLYGVISAHLAVALLGTLAILIHPLLAAVLHAAAGISYYCDSTFRCFLIRNFFPKHDSHNLLATAPAKKQLRGRIVFVSHADAAYTGWLFSPKIVHYMANTWILRKLTPLRKHMMWFVMFLMCYTMVDLLCFATNFGVANSFVDHLFNISLPPLTPWTPERLPLPFFYFSVSTAFLFSLILNLHVALRKQTVQGANDNLSGCVAMTILACRLSQNQPDDVEYVFVSTGCEEAGCGGANALIRNKLSQWDRTNTVFVGLDNIGGGTLCYVQEGEIFPMQIAPWLEDILQDIANQHSEFSELSVFNPPTGKTDIAASGQRRYAGVCLVNIERSTGVPRNYHLLSDISDNVDFEKLLEAVDLAEVISRRIENNFDK